MKTIAIQTCRTHHVFMRCSGHTSQDGLWTWADLITLLHPIEREEVILYIFIVYVYIKQYLTWYTWFWNTEHLLSGIKATCSAQLGTRPRQPQLPDVRKRTFKMLQCPALSIPSQTISSQYVRTCTHSYWEIINIHYFFQKFISWIHVTNC